MKKVIALCLTVVMALSLTVSVFAAADDFVSSPSTNEKSPMIISAENDNEDISGRLVVVPYSKRDTTIVEIRNQMEESFQQILAVSDLTKLNTELKTMVENAGLTAKEVAISDLFDIHYEGDTSLKNKEYDIILSAETFRNFVALLHFRNNAWEVVPDATVKEVNGEYHLTFSVESFSPFAVVVRDTSVSPKTGDNNNVLYLELALMAVSFSALVVLFPKRKEN